MRPFRHVGGLAAVALLLVACEGPREPKAALTTPLEPDCLVLEPGTQRQALIPAGTKTVLVLRVDFSDAPGDPVDPLLGLTLTPTEAQRLLTDTDAYLQRISYGQVTLNATVSPLLRMPQTRASYSAISVASAPESLRLDALQVARSSGLNPDAYDLEVLTVGRMPWPFAGIAYIGQKGLWLNGRFDVGVLAHELGHNFGANHASAWIAVDDGVIGPGTRQEYGDPFDLMGAQPFTVANSDLNAAFKSKLGWLDGGQVARTTTSGTFRLRAQDEPPLGTSLVALEVPRDTFESYWLEFRHRTHPAPALASGATVHLAGPTAVTHTRLLDMTPGSLRGFEDAMLPFGQTWSDELVGVHLTPLPVTGVPEAIDVVVHAGSFPSNSPPTVTIAPSVATVAPSAPIVLTATASDPNGDPLALAWDFDDGSAASNTASVTKSFATPGDYFVRCTASDMKGGRTTASALVTVGTPTTFSISGLVQADGGVPIEGARVSIAGRQSTGTDSTGRYVLTRLPAGTHLVEVVKFTWAFINDGFVNPVTVGPSASNANFRGTRGTYSISGSVTDMTSPVPGVLVSDGALTAITDAAGRYTLLGVGPGAHTVTATKPGYELQPNALWFTNPVNVTTGNVTNVNFERRLYLLSGQTLGLTAEAIVGLGDGVHVTSTFEPTPGASWSYYLQVPAGRWNLTAERFGWTLTPTFTSPVTVSADRTGLDFTASAVATGVVRGTVMLADAPLSDVAVTDGVRTSLTDSRGGYALIGVPSGAATVTPSLDEYVFSPPFQQVVVTTAGAQADFLATFVGSADAGPVDAGAPDGGADAGGPVTDAGPSADAGDGDAGSTVPDAGAADGGLPDGGPGDDAGADGGSTGDDGGSTDGGGDASDAGGEAATDAGTGGGVVGGCGCSSAPPGWLLAAALVVVASRRRGHGPAAWGRGEQ